MKDAQDEEARKQAEADAEAKKDGQLTSDIDILDVVFVVQDVLECRLPWCVLCVYREG